MFTESSIVITWCGTYEHVGYVDFLVYLRELNMFFFLLPKPIKFSLIFIRVKLRALYVTKNITFHLSTLRWATLYVSFAADNV